MGMGSWETVSHYSIRLRVVVFTVIQSDKVDPEYINRSLQYNSPERVIALTYEISNTVVLRNDYMPYELVVSVNKVMKIGVESMAYGEYKRYVSARRYHRIY